ncbi:MAG: restriction endonuclease subunit S [Phycisphaerae bacterium]|nr:restriction endonuclease subunit S [Phycisphaerae bacterium]
MKLLLKNREWKEFFISDIFSNIQRGKRLKKGDHKAGRTPYVSSTSMNNGIDNFIGNKENVRVFSSCLSLANSGSVGACFYQPFKFIASDHVTKLANDEFNKYILQFLSTIISRLGEKYSFNREINDTRIKREKIHLPTTREGKPDYAFMEAYMREKEQKKIKAYKNYVSKRISKLEKTKKVVSIAEKEWEEFELGKMFELIQGKSKGLNHLIKTKAGVNYLGATNLNNGVLCQVKEEPSLIQKGNSIAFIRNGEGSMGYSVYKTENFIATSDISVGYNPKLNRYVGTFITTVADKVRGKYNFGYKRSGKRLVKEKILLPIDENKEPDYNFMESYMKWIELNKLKEYLKYKKCTINRCT